MARVIRHRSFADPLVGEAMRDVQQALDGIPSFAIVKVTDAYSEPFYLHLPAQPQAILAVRVTTPATPEAPIAHGTAVEWHWDGSRARIAHVDGLTVGTRYAFTFLAVG